MAEPGIVVAIDGPSGVGKSTISRRIASELGLTYLDTGAMYRAVALFFKQNNVDMTEQLQVESALADISIELLPAASTEGDVGVLLNSADVSSLLRSPEMSMLASTVSAIPAVRAKLTSLQQQAGKRGRLVAEGRDTTTVVFPKADFKFFLEATPEERVARRARQLRERGREVDEKALLKMNYARDKQDSERAVAPLVQAADAVLVDTTGLTIDEVVERIMGVIRG
jgi:cytidylate kinase